MKKMKVHFPKKKKFLLGKIKKISYTVSVLVKNLLLGTALLAGRQIKSGSLDDAAVSRSNSS